MKARAALVAGVLLLLTGTAALAQNPQGPPGGGMGGMRGPGRQMQMLLNGITLTAQQQAQVDSIQARYQPQMRALFGRGMPMDSATRAQMATLRSDQQREIRAVLTPEQQKVFDKNVSELPPPGSFRRGPPGGQ